MQWELARQKGSAYRFQVAELKKLNDCVTYAEQVPVFSDILDKDYISHTRLYEAEIAARVSNVSDQLPNLD